MVCEVVNDFNTPPPGIFIQNVYIYLYSIILLVWISTIYFCIFIYIYIIDWVENEIPYLNNKNNDDNRFNLANQSMATDIPCRFLISYRETHLPLHATQANSVVLRRSTRVSKHEFNCNCFVLGESQFSLSFHV